MAPIKTHADVPGSSPQLREALRGAASALKENGPRFALAGSYALWAYGAPEPTHDVDLVVAESDVDDAVATLTNAVSQSNVRRRIGCSRPAAATRSWMCCTASTACGRNRQLDCAEQHEVLAIRMPVLPPTMVLVQQLRSLGEHYCDFAKLLPAVRAVHEQLDWARVRALTADNDYARQRLRPTTITPDNDYVVAFLVLVERLGLADAYGTQ